MWRRTVFVLGMGVLLAGCAGTRQAQLDPLRSQVASLDGRVTALEQRQATAEEKTWNQRDSLSSLRGRVDSYPAGVSGFRTSASVPAKPNPQQIQAALKQAGYYQARVDGKIGPKTKQAIREFQQAHQLTADGTVGPRTWGQLAKYLPAE